MIQGDDLFKKLDSEKEVCKILILIFEMLTQQLRQVEFCET